MYLCKTFVQQLGVLILLVESWRYPKNQRSQSLYQLWFFLSFVPTSPSITACVWSIYCCTKGLKVEKTHWAQKIDTPPCYLYPLCTGVTFTYKSLWCKFYCYYYCFGDCSLYMYSTVSSPLLNTTWTSKKRNFSKLKSRIPKEF